MSDLRKSAEMALERLERTIAYSNEEMAKIDAAKHALRQALAQPEPTVEDNSQQWKGMDGAVAWHLIDRHADNWADVGKMMNEWLKANQALEQPEQEPVAWMCEGDDWGAWVPVVFLGNDLEYHKKSTGFRNWKPLYTTPSKREWVGLTDEEAWEVYRKHGLSFHRPNHVAEYEWAICMRDFARDIAAKLKEKNT